VDTSSEESTSTDALGRRTGPRRQYSLEEKRRIVEETHVKGASVAIVARRHDLNANQVFAWRQLYRQGLLREGATKADGTMLPVKVTTPTLMPTERAVAHTPSKAQRSLGSDFIEIKLANGHGILVHGQVEGKALARVIDLLVRR